MAGLPSAHSPTCTATRRTSKCWVCWGMITYGSIRSTRLGHRRAARRSTWQRRGEGSVRGFNPPTHLPTCAPPSMKQCSSRGTNKRPGLAGSITRVGETSAGHILKHLWAGSQGVLIPSCNSAAEAEAVVRAVKYPCARAPHVTAFPAVFVSRLPLGSPAPQP